MNWSIAIIFILILILALIFLIFEKKMVTVKEISIIATLAGIAGALRVPFAAVPNVQPTTFLIIISGWVFGPLSGFMIGSVSVIVSNTFLGHGPWTPWQMLAWGMSGLISGILGRKIHKPNKLLLGMYGFIWGFLFDYIMNLWHWIIFIYPHTLKSLLATFMFSFYFDLLHAITNFLFLFFLGYEFILILKRFKNKLEYEVEE